MMSNGRRDWLKGGGIALLGSGFLSRVDAVAAQQRSSGGALLDTLKQAAGGPSQALLLNPVGGEEGPPEPTKAARLSLDWNKATVKRFREKLAERDLHAFLVRDPLNIIYLTGYWHTTTERPQAAFMNDDDA